MGFDYSQLREFYDNVKRARDNIEPFLIEFLKQEALWLEGETKAATPVDTGWLRKSWRVTGVRKEEDIYIFELINDADYASYVELGHATRNRKKWVEGRFMAKISTDKLVSHFAADFDLELIKFLARYGVL